MPIPDLQLESVQEISHVIIEKPLNSESSK